MMSNKQGPLSNITVLDLTRAVSGPYCTMMLQNLGATVIKIERPGTGDDTRGLGPFVDGVSSYNAIFNHGKKSIALNLKDPEDQKIFDQLLERCDVLVENFRPGVMERLGYGWEMLHEKYPKLIYAGISGYGLDGPISQHACYDLVAQGLCGIMTLTGHSEDNPTKVGTEIADVLSGIYGAFAINTALYHREVTGQGSLVDVAMLDCMLSLLYSAVDRFSATNEVPKTTGNHHPTAVPFDTFMAKDRHLNIAVANDSLFKKLCDIIGKPELMDDERFNSIPGRSMHRIELTDILAEVLKTKTAKEWVDACIAEGVPAGRVYHLDETLDFPQLQHRNMVCHFEDGYMPDIRFPGNPIKMSCLEETTQYKPAPALDENRTDILDFMKTGQWSGEAS